MVIVCTLFGGAQMKVHCLYDKLIPIADLKFHTKNPNKHTDNQVKRLAQILEFQGWRYPIKVSKLSGYITSGHGRVLAAIENKWKEVPVNYQEYENEDQEYADIVSDNSIAAWSELDFGMINFELQNFGPEFDIDLLGIKNFTLDMFDKDGAKELSSEEFETFANRCPRCGFEFDQFKNEDHKHD